MTDHVKFEMQWAIRKELNKIVSRLDNFDMNVVGSIIQERVDTVLDSQGAKGVDGKWQPFSNITLEMKPYRKGGKLLQDIGRLRYWHNKKGINKVTVLSPAKYAKFHVTGVPKRDLPKRDPFAINMDEMIEAVGIVLLKEAAP